MATALDDIIDKQAKRYGLTDRSELARIIIGRFIIQYDQNNEAVRKFLEEVTGVYLPSPPKNNNNNKNITKSSSFDTPPPPSPKKKSKILA